MNGSSLWSPAERRGAARLSALRRPGVSTVNVGTLAIGGREPVSVQSMTNTPTEDVAATVKQIRQLERAGCQLIRLAVPTAEAARALREIKRRAAVPLVADIHFNHRLALLALDAGVDQLRLNPGNIGGRARVREVARAAAAAGVPIRIGVNGGSLEPELEARFGGPTPGALVESALGHVRMLEDVGFRAIILSIKSSSVRATMEACRKLAGERPYPLHVGVTEAGCGPEGVTKSFLGIGLLLLEGLGETLRVSLTGPPLDEVVAGRRLLAALGTLCATPRGGLR